VLIHIFIHLKTRSFETCTIQQILFRWSNHEGREGRCI